MKGKKFLSRRDTLKGIGVIGASAILGSKAVSAETKTSAAPNAAFSSSEIRKTIFQKVSKTSFVDTHEHLLEENDRIAKRLSPLLRSDDWTMLLSYTEADMMSAGMSKDVYKRFFSPKIDPVEKWTMFEPYWPAIKNIGAGQAISIAIKELYGVDELSAKTIKKVQSEYERVRRPSFYKHILCDLANIESCQVNSLGSPFRESDMPSLLMQDLDIEDMFCGPSIEPLSKKTGTAVSSLSDWYKVIDWWFDKYGKYAVAVKSRNAYRRNIDYQKVPAEQAESVFKKILAKEKPNPTEKKTLEDHLFWYAVDKATEYNLPVKLHTGYHAGVNRMPLSQLMQNPAAMTDLCKLSPATKFVFLHTCYPYYEECVAIAKHWTNAHIEMSWTWIGNPVAAKDFLKKYLVTAPSNKVFTFGGDYIPVEPVIGHAVLARKGITLALSELVEEGWLSLDNALELVEPVMNTNAKQLFNLAEKTKILKDVKWV